MNNRKIVTRNWKWCVNTRVWANFEVGGSDNVPLQVRKFISREIQKVLVERMVELEAEATVHGLMYDINDIDEDWFMTKEEVNKIVEEKQRELGLK